MKRKVFQTASQGEALRVREALRYALATASPPGLPTQVCIKYAVSGNDYLIVLEFPEFAYARAVCDAVVVGPRSLQARFARQVDQLIPSAETLASMASAADIIWGEKAALTTSQEGTDLMYAVRLLAGSSNVARLGGIVARFGTVEDAEVFARGKAEQFRPEHAGDAGVRGWTVENREGEVVSES